jgi:hypothetical protein
VLVGTMKGAFVFRSNAARKKWDVGGPYFPGHAVYALAYDSRAGRRRLWASTTSMHWGSILRKSDDFGRTWTDPEQANVKFPEDTGLSLRNIWQIRPGPAERPNTLWAGVEPASLFESNDDGETWSLVRGLHDHPHRARWEPGGGGLCLHTILHARIPIACSSSRRRRLSHRDGGRPGPSEQGRARRVPRTSIRVRPVRSQDRQHEAPTELYRRPLGLYRTDDGRLARTSHNVPSDFSFRWSSSAIPTWRTSFRSVRHVPCDARRQLRVYRATASRGRRDERTAEEA